MAALPIVQGKQLSWLDLCKQVLGPSASNVKVQPAGSLWGGYGSVTRLSVDVDGKKHNLVAKQVGIFVGAATFSLSAVYERDLCQHALVLLAALTRQPSVHHCKHNDVPCSEESHCTTTLQYCKFISLRVFCCQHTRSVLRLCYSISLNTAAAATGRPTSRFGCQS
eukprot:GHUV01044344.1.p1 GENE.GHUV01044344.1~~GHUV01044344.1.p1  ORF type:complete len:166 (+),score=32.02 GHUV01044344.1:494-991(+)